MKIVLGPASRDLGIRVAKLMKGKVVDVKSKTFPDGETYVRLLGDVKGEDVAIIQTTAPSQDKRIIELFLLIDAVKDLGAKSITTVVPYLAYARQDRRFLKGEALSLSTIIGILNNLGIDKFITFNVHEEQSIGEFSMEAKNLSAIAELAKYFKRKGLGGPLAFAPDQGAIEIVKEASGVLGGGYGWIVKKRDKETGEIRLEEKRIDVKNRNVIVFDDIISTGGTMASVIKMLAEQGAAGVYAACVHPLLIGEAIGKIMLSKARGIVGTDCVQSPVSVVSVAPLIAKELGS